MDEYLENILEESDRYSGFNLILGSAGKELFYYSNRASGIERLEKGCYGLSNHLLNSSWPKVTNGLKRFKKLVSKEDLPLSECFELLSDSTLAADAELPDTGLELDRERALSSIFIRTPTYGTRSSTVVKFYPDRGYEFEEKIFV